MCRRLNEVLIIASAGDMGDEQVTTLESLLEEPDVPPGVAKAINAYLVVVERNEGWSSPDDFQVFEDLVAADEAGCQQLDGGAIST